MGRPKHDQYEHLYLPPEPVIVLNQNDADLFPIRVNLLDLIQRTFRQYGLKEPTRFPPFRKMANYGLPPEEQIFYREETPEALVSLEKQIRNDLKKDAKAKRFSAIKQELDAINIFWERLEEESEKYAEEIAWLERMWSYRLFGRFYLINGVATYFTGDYFFFLNWWWLDDTLPEYRLWDGYLMLGAKFAELDTTTFKNIDPQTRKPIPNEDGTFEMIDTGRRVCLGVNDPKARRVGDTSKFQCRAAEMILRTAEAHFGTQGRDEPHAKKVFQQNFVHPFEKLPIFWKPVWDSSLGVRPKENLLFDGETSGFGLHSRVTHALSASAEHYNGDKLAFYHNDESGNNSNSMIDVAHGIVKHCCTLGDKIRGYAAYTTTVDSIDAGSAGENYMKLCMDSLYEIRDENGRTASWMYDLFVSAIYRMEGFIDKFGNPVIDDPTPEQARFIGKKYGSRKYIENTVNELTRKKDWSALSTFQRQYPLSFRDCFSPPGKNQFFAVELMRNRISYLNFTDRSQLPKRGDFVWKFGVEGEVEWVDNTETGKFFKSREFSPNEVNQKKMWGGSWCPIYPERFVASADTFGQDKTLGRASNGGGAVRWLFDPMVDNPKAESRNWQSSRLCITYENRPDTVEEYCEDMLKMCIYTGALMFPENNKTDISKYFRRMGYEGFLLYDVDRLTGKPKPEPGFYSQEKTKQRLFNLMRDEIAKNAERTTHVEWLEDSCAIRDVKDMTNYDRWTAIGGTLLAQENPFYSFLKNKERANSSGIILLPETAY